MFPNDSCLSYFKQLILNVNQEKRRKLETFTQKQFLFNFNYIIYNNINTFPEKKKQITSK